MFPLHILNQWLTLPISMCFAGPGQDVDYRPTLLCKGRVWVVESQQERLYLLAKFEIGKYSSIPLHFAITQYHLDAEM
jgi:hypothetical protein